MTSGIRGPRLVELPAAFDTLDDARAALGRLSSYSRVELARLHVALAELLVPAGRGPWSDADRAICYELVERELRERGVDQLVIGAHVICAVRRCGDDSVVRAPMPTLLGAVDLLGLAPADGGP